LVNDAEAVLYATRAGRGIARLLSYQAADDLAAGTLAPLLVDFEPDRHPFNSSRRARRIEPRSCARFSITPPPFCARCR
jgi:DNA-binding transcriptional LysR family regulator